MIAVTDCFSTPIGKFSKGLHFTVASSSKTLLESAVGAITVAERLCSLTIHKLGLKVQERIRRNETFLVRSDEYLPTGRRSVRDNN